MFGHYQGNTTKSMGMKPKKKPPATNTEMKQELTTEEQAKINSDKKRENRRMLREEAQKESANIFEREQEGLSPEKRQAMQYEANKGIQRSVQGMNRKLLGDQSQRGIVGKSGVGYAQQRDLQKLGMEAQAGVHRDLDQLNEDLRMKKIAARFAYEQGEISQAQLDEQMALDQLNLEQERKRQRELEDRFYGQFMRV